MTASSAEFRTRGFRRALGAAAIAIALAGPGCRTPAGAPPESAFAHSPAPQPAPPDAADRSAVQLARASLVSDEPAMLDAVAQLDDLDRVLATFEEPTTGLFPVALDLRNTTLDDDLAYRARMQELLARDDLSPELRARLELYAQDAPLALATDRMRDAWLVEIGRAFNTLAQPIGSSITTAQLAPIRLGRSLLDYATWIYTREALDIHRRQALVHWREFLARHPEAPGADAIRNEVARLEALWRETQYDRALRVAHAAWKADKYRLALIYSERALRYQPEAGAASELRRKAEARLAEVRRLQDQSLGAAATEASQDAPEASRALALALLLPGGDIEGAARALRAADPEGALADEADYALALVAAESSADPWPPLTELAHSDFETSNMARHAAALAYDPDVNHWAAFRQAERRAVWDRIKWIFVGPFYGGLPDRGIPEPVDWVLSAPSIAESFFGTPFRLINTPWAETLPATRIAAAYARRLLEREPRGAHSEAARRWLIDHETRRGNHAAALSLAEAAPEPDLGELADLREQAAAQMLRGASRELSLPARLALYRQVAQVYPGSGAAQAAADLTRFELEHASLQQIQIARSFLLQNHTVAGPEGLDLQPALLDEESSNGEIHPEGLTLIGQQRIRISYLAPSGDPSDEPIRRIERLSAERLARAISQLEEVTYRNELLDPLDDTRPDALRDVYFERVRLGLPDATNAGLASASSYRYVGVKERYGMVRARESILPFDLVFSGSFRDLSLGAYPRIRSPRPTPTQFLFE